MATHTLPTDADAELRADLEAAVAADPHNAEANNQLASAADGERLHKRGILYAPDFVINAGGIISVAAEREQKHDGDEVTARIARIHERTLELLNRARETNYPPHEVADEMAREIIGKARKSADLAA